MSEWVSQAELARRLGVTARAVSRQKKLWPVDALNGRLINLEHPKVAAYMKKDNGRRSQPTSKKLHGGEISKQAKKDAAAQDQQKTYQEAVTSLPERIREFAEWPLVQIIMRFGTDQYFVDYLKSVKTIEEIEEKRLRSAANRGELVSRDLIKRGIIDTMEQMFIRMLSDGVKTIAARAGDLARAGADPLEIEDMVHEQIASFIKPCKSKMARVVKNA